MVRIQSMQSNQMCLKAEARQAIDDVLQESRKKQLIKHQMRQQKKRSAKAKVDQAVTEAKGHINEVINNSVSMKQNKWYNYNQCNPTRNNQKSEARQAIDDVAKAKKK